MKEQESVVELVVKMPSKMWERVKVGYVPLGISKYLKNGTPLPKGHGRLIDANVMIDKLCTQEASEFFGSATCAEILNFIDDEKPIIEADKEGGEG